MDFGSLDTSLWAVVVRACTILHTTNSFSISTIDIISIAYQPTVVVNAQQALTTHVQMICALRCTFKCNIISRCFYH